MVTSEVQCIEKTLGQKDFCLISRDSLQILLLFFFCLNIYFVPCNRICEKTVETIGKILTVNLEENHEKVKRNFFQEETDKNRMLKESEKVLSSGQVWAAQCSHKTEWLKESFCQDLLGCV